LQLENKFFPNNLKKSLLVLYREVNPYSSHPFF